MRFNDIPEELPAEFIGPPLQQGFKNIFGMNEKETAMAVSYFREYYGNHGLYENLPYEGISELLAELASQGKHLYVATSKLEKYAWEIIKHFEFDKYIEDLTGADYAGNHSKARLIETLINKYRLGRDESIMIGDTLFDIEGAHAAGIKCVAVGYGFDKREILLAGNPDYYAEDMDELGRLLLG